MVKFCVDKLLKGQLKRAAEGPGKASGRESSLNFVESGRSWADEFLQT